MGSGARVALRAIEAAPHMTSDRWQQITAIFHAALARDAAERSAFVAANCAGDSALRREVQSMLAAHLDAGGFGETPAFAAAALPDVRSAVSEVALPRGTRVGPYETMSLLGMGGMGVVYRARDTRLQRDVALKVLLPSIADHPDRLARFGREARVLASLNHPHIAHIYGIEDADGVRAIVMEFVAGSTLADRIAQGPIPPAEALPIARQVAEALESAHELGVVHRDLKPANVKVRDDGTVKVLDFGLAKALDTGATRDDTLLPPPTSAQTMTMPGVVLGTIPYMAPEQVSGKPADRRADIWALGCVLFEMLSGTRAFAGNDADTMVAVLSKEPNWDALPPSASAIHPLLVRCLRKDPRQRLQAIGDVRIHLDELMAGGSGSYPAAFRKPSRARLAAMLLAGLAAGAAVAGVASWTFRPAVDTPAVQFDVSPPEDHAFGLSPIVMSISPDGRTLAFHANSREGGSSYWVRPLEARVARKLPGTDGLVTPRWSSDSRFLIFLADGKLKKIDVSNGVIQTLTEEGSAQSPGASAAAGVILFRLGRGNVFQVPASGGASTPVTTLDQSRSEVTHDLPQLLPDGRHFIYHAQSTRAEYDGIIYAGSLDSPGVTPILTSDSQAVYAPPGYLLYMRSNTLVAHPFDVKSLRLTGEPVPVVDKVDYNNLTRRGAFSVSNTGTLAYRSPAETQLVWFDRSGRALESIAPLARYGNPALSPDEQRVAVDRVDPETGTRDIWLFDLARSGRSRLTVDAAQDQQPIWSADGQRLIFMSNRGGQTGFYVKSVIGAGQEERVAGSVVEASSPDEWTRDGQSLIYSAAMNGFTAAIGGDGPSLTLFEAPLSGNSKPVQIMPGVTPASQAQQSPDGQWLAYVSREAGRADVYVRRYRSDSGQRLISPNGGVEPRWRRDGRELFYLALDQTLMSVPITADDRTFEPGQPTPLFATRMLGFQGTNTRNQYVVTADGQRFLINQPPQGTNSSPISIIVNWPSLLKKTQP
jgi:Tol biopolymer transport system component